MLCVLKIFSFLCVFWTCAVAAAVPASVDVPLDHWAYRVLERFSARGLMDMHSLSSRPLNRIQMAKMTKEVIKQIRGYDGSEKPWAYTESLQDDLDKLTDEFRFELVSLGELTLAGKEEEPHTQMKAVYPLRLERIFADMEENDTTLMRNRNGWRLKEGGNFRASVRSWGTLGNTFAGAIEPVYFHNRDDDDVTLDEAYVRGNISNMELSVGRQNMWWGPGSFGSLILSNNAPPLDNLKIKNVEAYYAPWIFEHLGELHATYFFSQLKKTRDIPHAKLTGLRVTAAPHQDVVLGLSKTVMMGGDRDGDDLGVDDIFKGFVVSNENEPDQADNNQITMFDMMWRLRGTDKYLPFTNNIILYDQLAADGEESNGLSNLAYLLGAYFPDVFYRPGLSLRTEYASTRKHGDSARWYSHGLYSDGYTHKGFELGHFMGGDAESATIRLEQAGFWKDEHVLGLQVDRVRSFISEPDTEDRWRFSIDFTFYKNAYAEANFGYILEHINQYQRQEGSEATNHIIEISGRVEF